MKEIPLFSINRVPLEGSFGTMYSAQKKSVKLVVITVILHVRKQSWRKIGIVIEELGLEATLAPEPTLSPSALPALRQSQYICIPGQVVWVMGHDLGFGKPTGPILRPLALE